MKVIETFQLVKTSLKPEEFDLGVSQDRTRV